MATPRFAWGIDIGNRALKAIRLVRDGERLRVDDVDVIEHEQILSTAGDNRESLIHTALANFVARHEVKGGIFGIGVSGQASFARFIKLPPVEPKKIPEIVRFEAIQQIPFPLDDVEWAYQLFQNPDSPDVEVGIFAMRKDLVRAVIKNYTDLDMNVQAVQMNPLAVYNHLYYDQRVDGCIMVVDIGAENTDLIIADGETVWLRNIPVGGNAFTEALSKQFKLNFVKAEELKRNAATSKYARQILQTLRPVFDDLVGEIQRSIGFYASGHRDSRIKNIVAMGSTFRLPQLQKYLQNKLQLEVVRIDNFAGGAPADSKMALILSENMLSMSAAYGLAVQAMGEAKIESSLLPQAIKRAKMWREKTKWFAAAAAIFVVGTVAAFGRQHYDDAQFHSPDNFNVNVKPSDNALGDAIKANKQWADLQGAGHDDEQRCANYASLAFYHDVWPLLLIDLNDAAQLGMASTTNSAEIVKTKRAERKEMTLTGLSCRYVHNIDPYIFPKMSEEELRTAAAGELPKTMETPPPKKGAPPPPTPKRGYLLTVNCTTPNTATDFIEKTFLATLRQMTEQAAQKDPTKRPYFVGNSAIALRQQFQADRLMSTKLNMRSSSRLLKWEAANPAAPGETPVAPSALPGGDVIYKLPDVPATMPSINAWLDPRLPSPSEDMRNDYSYSVILVIVLRDEGAGLAAASPTPAAPPPKIRP